MMQRGCKYAKRVRQHELTRLAAIPLKILHWRLGICAGRLAAGLRGTDMPARLAGRTVSSLPVGIARDLPALSCSFRRAMVGSAMAGGSCGALSIKQVQIGQ